jgi:transcriptional regulator GlxA family with amidase domain
MIYTQSSKNYQITQAILWLKNNYNKPLRIDDLAKLVYMALLPSGGISNSLPR